MTVSPWFPLRPPSQQWATSFQAALDAQSLAAWTLADHYLQNDELNWGEEIGSERLSPLDFAIGHSHAWGVELLLKNGIQVTPTSVYYAVEGMYLKRYQPEVLQQRLDTIWHILRPAIMARDELRDTAVACFLDSPWDSVEKQTGFMWEAMGMAEVSAGRLAQCLDSRFYKARLSPLQLAWLSGWPEAMLLLLEEGSSPCQVLADSDMPNWSLHEWLKRWRRRQTETGPKRNGVPMQSTVGLRPRKKSARASRWPWAGHRKRPRFGRW